MSGLNYFYLYLHILVCDFRNSFVFLEIVFNILSLIGLLYFKLCIGTLAMLFYTKGTYNIARCVQLQSEIGCFLIKHLHVKCT